MKQTKVQRKHTTSTLIKKLRGHKEIYTGKNLHFLECPLTVVMAFTELGSTTKHRSYKHVFQDHDILDETPYNPDMLHWSIQDAKDDEALECFKKLDIEAREIIEHFKLKISLRCLDKDKITEYDRRLKKALQQMEYNVLGHALLDVVVKLPEFYKIDKQMAEISQTFVSATESDYYTTGTQLLTFEKIICEPQRNLKNKFTVIWRNEQDQMFLQNIPKCEFTRKLLESQPGKKYSIDLTAYTRTDVITGFVLYVCTDFNIES